MTPERLVELKEHLEDSELTIEESVECLDEIQRLTTENAELKHQIEVEAMQNSERINDLQSENAEIRKKIPLYRDLVARHRHAMGYLDCNESHSLKELGEP